MNKSSIFISITLSILLSGIIYLAFPSTHTIDEVKTKSYYYIGKSPIDSSGVLIHSNLSNYQIGDTVVVHNEWIENLYKGYLKGGKQQEYKMTIVTNGVELKDRF